MPVETSARLIDPKQAIRQILAGKTEEIRCSGAIKLATPQLERLPAS